MKVFQHEKIFYMEINDILNSLIYDRTQADVDYALSLQNESIHTDIDLRGAYNASDRNRVGAAVNRLIDALRLLGLHVKDDWDMYDTVRIADNANTLACLRTLQAFLPFGTTFVLPVDLDNLTYQKANEIERVLYEAGTAYLWILDAAVFAGDGYSSEFDAPNQQIFDGYLAS